MSIIIGNNQSNVLNGTSGTDIILGNNGNDTINGGAGTDLIDGGNGDDAINGGAGHDLISGGNGNDTILGGSGNDFIDGGNGNDTLNGGAGSDVIEAGKGDDLIIHDATESSSGDWDFYDGEQGRDTLRLIVSQATYNSAAFQTELARFQSTIAKKGTASGTFDTLNVQFSSIERIEVVIKAPANQAPTDIFLSGNSIAENSTAGTVIANLTASDPNGAGPFTFEIVGPNDHFEVVGNHLQVKAGAVLDFESAAAHVVTLRVTDAGGLSFTKEFQIAVSDVNEAPTVSLTNQLGAIPENGEATKVADIVVSDDALGSYETTLSGADAIHFEIRGTELWFKGGADYETKSNFDVQVIVEDPVAGTSFADFSLAITNVNEAPTGITLNQPLSLKENVTGFEIGELSGIDQDEAETFTYTVDDSRFEVDGNILKLKADAKVDYESEPTITVFVTATDSAGLSVTRGFSLSVQDGYEATAIDGYVSGATVFADANNNGVLDDGEVSTTTDGFGEFTLFGGSGPLVMFGGIDISTNKPFLGTMRAPEGSTVVTPLTTLVAAILDTATEQQPISVSQANNLVLAGLGLPTGVNLSSFDPIAATVSSDPVVQAQGAASIAAAIQVQNTIVQAAAVLEGAGGSFTSAATSVVTALATQITQAPSSAIDLGSGAVVATVITSAAATTSGVNITAVSNVVNDVSQVITNSNELVQAAASTSSGTDLLESLAQVSSVAQDATTSLATATSSGDTTSVIANYTGEALTTAVETASVGNVAGVNGDDTIAGTEAADTLYGYGGNDTLNGLGGRDILIGGDGDDILDGGLGNDRLTGGIGNDILNGGAGIDTAVYTDAIGSIAVALAAGTVSGAGVGTDTLIAVENVTGGNFADSYNATGFGPASTNAGSTGALNGFEGMGGDDTITGNGSTIVLYTNATGGVTVDIAAGTATSTAGGDAAGIGTDTFLGGISGITASAFDDTLRGSNISTGSELFIGGAGDDLIDGRGGFDRVNYASIVDDTVTGGVSINMASGIVTGDASVGSDTLRGIEAVRGSRFDDSYVATGFSNVSANAGSNGTFNEFEGMGGNDTITGNGNTRIAFYNATGAVSVDLAAGTATGDASVGSDTITGGVNSVTGSQFSDTMSGSDNAPGTGEAFEGRAGDDFFDGRGGFDTAVYNTDNTVNAGIVVDMAAGTVTSTSAAIGTDTLRAVESIRATNFADTYDATGFDGSSTNAGSFGNFNEFEGFGGNDSIIGNGNTRISYVNASGPVTVDMTTGIATGNASVGTDTFSGVSQVRGSNAGDTIIGNEFNNNLDGQGGNDTLTGGAGSDTLTGGGGTDTFVFADGFGFDTITDFNQAQGDRIDLTGVTAVTDFATLQTFALQDGTNTVIDFTDGNVITLNNVTLTNLTQNDFIFGEAVNPAPTDLSLQVDTVAENTPVGTVIGLVLVVDNPGDTLTFELLDDAGGRFALDGNNLVVAGPLDYESATSHDITVRVTDSANNTYEETLTVNVSNVNEAPTDIALSASTMAENSAADTVVGALSTIDPDGGDSATYTLIDDAGGRFALDGSNIVVAGALDYESAASHQVTVRVTDAGGLTHDETLTIDVTNVNEAPTSISLTTSTIAENSPAGSLVGSLMASDPDGIESATFTLLDDAGGLFAIDGNGIVAAGALDYETETSHQVTVRVTDAGGNTYDETFTIDVTNASGTVTGTSDADPALIGTSEEDTITGLTGNDVLQGLAGNDTLNGGVGLDRGIYIDATGGLTINLAAGTVTGAGVGTDTLISIENIRGGNFADVYNANGFSGSSANAGSNSTLNSFEGMGGNDTIIGNGSTIALYQNALAGVTVDLLAGTAQGIDANDLAGIGTDTLSGVVSVAGSAFNDTLQGSNLTTTIESFIGNGGNDLIDGRGGLDRANYATILDDTVTGGISIDMASGIVTGDASVGTDTLRGIEFVRGSQFADTYVATGFSGSSANAGFNGTFNEFEGMGGNDTITGNGNTRLAFYNATGGVTVDIAAGTTSGDASVGNDTFSGVNNITGSQFGDTMSGSDNAPGTGEAFEGRAGNDFIDGRGGFDTAIYNNDPTVNAGIVVDMAAGTVTSTSAAIGTDTLRAVESIRATNFADSYDATGFDGSSANAGSFGNFNEFEGLAGNDTIIGNGNTRISYVNASGPVTVDMTTGIATGNASVGTDTFSGVSQVRGSNTGDTITGNEFNNNLDGQGGNDTITGGEGNDTLTGGGGTDTFVFADGFGFDTITDFNHAQGDKIDLTGVTSVTDFATLLTLASENGANTVIDFGNGDVITLNNVTLANLTASNFIFGEAVNPAPTDLSLQVDTVAENTPVGTVIGLVLVVDNPGDTLTFELLDDAGGRFALDGNNLVVAGPLDYESAASHDITVRVTDSANNTYEETLTVNVSNVNEAPTDIALSASTVAENSAADTIVGTLSTIDPDSGDSATYTLIDDAGGRFALDGSNIVVSGALDYESAASHQVTVRVTDAGGLTHDETLTIDVTNVNEAPTSISLTTSTVAENSPAGSLVGSLMASDPDGIESATFTILEDAGGLFAIDGTGLVVAGALDYETATSHQVTVRVTDAGGNTYDETFTIDVTNVSGTVTGTPDADPALVGTSEEDTITAQGGDDILQGLAGNDILDGGTGNDRAVYTDATGGITVNLSAGTVSGAGVGTDTLLSVESITGSNFADLYNAAGFGPASPNAPSVGILNGIEALGGDDTIIGNGNTIVSYLSAAAGVTVDLQAGNAQGVDAGDVANVGTDTLTGIFAVVGSAFNDILRGSNTTSGLEFFNGNAGDDLIDGRGGFDRVNYSSLVLADDTVTGGVSINMASGIVTGDASVGTDTLRGIEAVRGSRFDDTYVATGFSNVSANAGSNGTFNEFEGMAGNDTITGNGNTRIAFYNATGAVTVDLAAGTATGNASVGSDTITGGVNSVTGSQFGDTLSGSDNAQGTNEQFDGRAGNDTFDGRGGFDIAVYNTDGTVNAGIVVDMAAGTVTSTSAAIGTDTLQGIEGIRGTNFADTYDATGFGPGSTNAGSLGNFNEFDGQGGNDIITGNGNTQIVYGSATAGVTVDLAAGTATGNASVGIDTILGGVSRVLGSGFNDIITGNEFNNTLNGQGGNDTLTGGAGNDTLTGGGGTDSFVFADGFGFDTITDFNQAQGDKIDLTGVTSVTDFATLQSLATQSGANTFIDFGGGNALTLNNVTLANLAASNFTFGEAVNPAPTDLSLQVDTVAENTPVGTVIGLVLVVDNPGDTLAFELLDDAGGRFAIANGNNLVVAGALDHETAATHDITVRVTDSANNTYEETLTVNVSNVNEAPTDIALSASTAGENSAAGTIVGTLSTIDPDAGDSTTYTLIDGAGGRFALDGSNLVVAGALDYETAASHQVTVRVTDAGGLTHDETLTIDVTNVNEAPTSILLTTNSIAENSPAGSLVGSLMASDPDGIESATFTILDDAGGLFAIDGTGLVVAGALDYESATSHQVTVRVTDAGGNTYDETFTIDVTNVSGTVTGTPDADPALIGTSEEDTITGLAGNDVLQGLAGNDILNGGAGGGDRAVYTDATGGITVNLAAGTVSGAGVGTDTLLSVEMVRGSNFADIFNAVGFSGSSTNSGSNGILNTFEGMGGDDTVTGNGATILYYQNALAGVTVELGGATGSLASGTAQSTAADDAAGIGIDTFTGISGIYGSVFNDVLRGSNTTSTVELFIANSGDDLIDGRGGLDRVNYASIVDDNVTGGLNIDMASGILVGDASVGTDTLRSIEFVRGSQFADSYVATGFSGSSANAGSNGTFNEFEGMAGNDTITGNGNTRIAFYNATGGVAVDLTAGSATGNASVGSDTITGGVNSIAGSNFADTLYGTDNAPGTGEAFEGRAGNDFIDGRGGFDTAVYNTDNTVNAGIVVDMAAGTVTSTSAAIGTDTLRAVESIRATNFADTYDATGFDGSSTNAGSFGNFNEFEGFGGNDTIIGNGNTRISYVNASGPVTVDMTTGIATGNASVGTDTFSGVSQVRGSNAGDTIVGHEFNNNLDGQGGNDTLTGGEGNDTLTGGGGTDTFVFADGFGFDTITDFNQAQGDRIDLTGVTALTDFATLQSLAIQDGVNTVIDFADGNTITLNNVNLANLTANDFLL